MDKKIQELTEKIFQEGVVKGEEQAKKIVADAQEKAMAIIADAKARAQKSIADAKQQALEMKRTAEAEIKLAGTQALSSIKRQIVDSITASMIDSNMNAVLSDPATIKEFVSIIVHNWKTTVESPCLEVLLPAQKQEELRKAFEKGASDLMKKGLTLSFSKSIKAGFRIGPKGGVFKISLTDEDFSEFIKEYIHPKTRSYLFGE
jgi:V/A-type H+-transporting ATPase subunit E